MRRNKRSWWNVPGRFLAHYRSLSTLGKSLVIVSAVVAAFAAGALVDALFLTPVQVTPVTARFGWEEKKAIEMRPEVAKNVPKLAIKDPKGNIVTGRGKTNELWKFAKLVNGGKHLPTWRQESGDCTSMAESQAGNYAQVCRIATVHKDEELRLLYPPFNYGIGRTEQDLAAGQFGRGAGSTGYFAVMAGCKYGHLSIDDAEKLGYKYSGRQADQWGLHGVPQAAKDIAKHNCTQAYSQVTSWSDVVDAINNNYPVIVCSNVGFDGPEYVADGRAWLTPRGSWPHAMVFIGVEDRPGHTKGALCQNSWGEDWGPKPRNGEPPGSFWVDHQTVHRMVSQGDSFAISDFDGFPAPDKDIAWDAFTIEIETTGSESEKAAVVAAETPEIKPVLEETRKSWAGTIGLVLGAFSAVCLVAGLRQKHCCSSRSQSA